MLFSTKPFSTISSGSDVWVYVWWPPGDAKLHLQKLSLWLTRLWRQRLEVIVSDNCDNKWFSRCTGVGAGRSIRHTHVMQPDFLFSFFFVTSRPKGIVPLLPLDGYALILCQPPFVRCCSLEWSTEPHLFHVSISWSGIVLMICWRQPWTHLGITASWLNLTAPHQLSSADMKTIDPGCSDEAWLSLTFFS